MDRRRRWGILGMKPGAPAGEAVPVEFLQAALHLSAGGTCSREFSKYPNIDFNSVWGNICPKQDGLLWYCCFRGGGGGEVPCRLKHRKQFYMPICNFAKLQIRNSVLYCVLISAPSKCSTWNYKQIGNCRLFTFQLHASGYMLYSHSH